MGHAIRSGVILEKLTKMYNVYIFSGDKAYNYLNEKFDNVYEIGVYKTIYDHNSVNDIATFIQCMKSTPSDIKKAYRTLFKLTRKLKPNIIVSDFENYSNLISNIMHIPLISLDNIHMITEAKIDLPPKHKKDFFKASVIVKLYVQYAKIHILTSFFNPPIREGFFTKKDNHFISLDDSSLVLEGEIVNQKTKIMYLYIKQVIRILS